MSELTFTKSFLTTLDSKPPKFSSDHIITADTAAALSLPRTPYTLPKLPHPPYPLPPSASSASPAPAPGSTPSSTVDTKLTITLKSTRNPSLEITIHDASARDTRIEHLREAVRKEIREKSGADVDVAKVKVLWRKKPVAAGKDTVADVLLEDGQELGVKEVEFGVLVLGGVPTTTTTQPMEGVERSQAQQPEQEQGQGATAVAQGPSGKEVLATEVFWDDLKGFLVQRLRDESEAERVVGLFRSVV